MLHDPDQEYPKHQPGRQVHDHHDPFETDVQEEGDLEDPQHKGLHQRDDATTPQLPHAHRRKAVIAGLIAGALYEIARVTITLMNASLYQEGAKYQLTSMPAGLAAQLTGLGALGYAIGAVLFFLGGLLIGRIAVQRRWAFIGGFVGGVLCALVGSLLQQISSYPNAGHTGFSGGFIGISSGFLILIIYSLFLCAITGAISLLGGWLVTRHHPYYVGYYG